MHREAVIATLKSILRPIARQRMLWEKAKYWNCSILSPEAGNDLLASLLKSHRPAAIGKMGASELGGLRHYLRYRGKDGICRTWGRHEQLLNVNAGVYPPAAESLSDFCRIYSDTVSCLDVMGVWYNRGEYAMRTRFASGAQLVAVTAFEPFYHGEPWSQHLVGKRVLVVSPFSNTIQRQHANRAKVWQSKPAVLPDFELLTLRSPLSAGLVPPTWPTWHVALDAMKQRMREMKFDVAIVGAGAWSLPLVAHARSLGAWAIHLGGPTQILFGIRGGRWDAHPRIAPLMNDAWCRPGEDETPRTARKVENACYW